MKLRMFSLFLCFFIFMSSFTSFAAIASASDALSSTATSSDLLPAKSFSLRSTYAISNEGLEYTLMAGVFDSNNKLVSSRVGTRKEEVGGYVRYSFPVLTSGQKYGRVYYSVSSVPSFGTYGVTASFKEANVGLDPSTASNGAFIILGSGSDYVNTEWTDVRTSVSSTGSTYNVKGNITFDRYIQSINVGFYFSTFLNTFDILVPKSNPVALSFSSQGDVTAVPPSSGSAGDGFQYEVASGLSSIGDTLEEIVLTISYQLEALWDQIYNFVHLPQYEKLEQIRQAIENLDLNIDVDQSELIAKIQEQMKNDNANTDRLINSYDNSSITQSNDDLNQSIDDYDSQEQEVMDQVSGYVSDFEYESYFDKFTAPMSDISYFLTGIYNGLAGLNIPIGFSLTLMIALICIGFYRFKGGG